MPRKCPQVFLLFEFVGPKVPQNSRQNSHPCLRANLGGRFGYFLFFLLGGGEGGARGAEKGEDDFLLQISGGGGGLLGGRGGGARGWEGACRELGGRGAKYFFSGPKGPPRNRHDNLPTCFWGQQEQQLESGASIKYESSSTSMLQCTLVRWKGVFSAHVKLGWHVCRT